MIYLASQSPRRRKILRKIGISFRTVPTRYQERVFQNMSPDALSLRHAIGKAKGAKVPRKGRFVLGADTVVWCQKKILGKPGTEREAIEMLRLISGRMHVVYTGVVILDRKTKKIWKDISKTKVRIKRLSKQGISDYLKVIHPYDKAGSYAIGEGPKIIERIDGSYTNVMGLPVELVRTLFAQAAKNGREESS